MAPEGADDPPTFEGRGRPPDAVRLSPRQRGGDGTALGPVALALLASAEATGSDTVALDGATPLRSGGEPGLQAQLDRAVFGFDCDAVVTARPQAALPGA